MIVQRLFSVCFHTRPPTVSTCLFVIVHGNISHLWLAGQRSPPGPQECAALMAAAQAYED